MKKDLLTLDELSSAGIEAILALAGELKAKQKDGVKQRLLAGKSIALIFEKPSTRTRISFEVGIFQLGAHPVYLSHQDMQLSRGETIEDTARVLSRYVDAIIVRTFEQADLERMADASTVPVINALTDGYHPCQALTDVFTIKEKKGSFSGLKFAYLGDGNNVCHSLLLAAAKVGLTMWVATPEGFSPREEVVDRAKEIGRKTGSEIVVTREPIMAAENADILYTDVWVSMGDEGKKEARLRVFRPYQVNGELVSHAKEKVLIMHCLPAHRGEEITGDVIDGPNSVVFDQAENRLHAQKALLVHLLQG
ncbi:MAG: ornithine carbamoyltransferase [Actinomycetota bacterium]